MSANYSNNPNSFGTNKKEQHNDIEAQDDAAPNEWGTLLAKNEKEATLNKQEEKRKTNLLRDETTMFEMVQQQVALEIAKQFETKLSDEAIFELIKRQNVSIDGTIDAGRFDNSLLAVEDDESDKLLQNQNEDGVLDVKLKESILSLLKSELADLESRRTASDHEEEQVEVEENAEVIDFSVKEDVFSLMMFYPFESLTYWIGLLTFIFQLVLVIMLYESLHHDNWDGVYHYDEKNLLNIPFGVTKFVRVGQYLVAFLSIAFQTDIHDAIHYFLLLRKGNQHNWKILVENQAYLEEDEALSIIWSVYFPNLLRLCQGGATLWIVTVIIKKNDDFLELLMNFTSIYIVSEIDDIFFKLIRKGFYPSFHVVKTAANIENVKFRHRNKGSECCGWRSVFNTLNLRSLVLVGSTVYLLLEVAKLQQKQENGDILREVYPDCYVRYPILIGDGHCNRLDYEYVTEYNTEECGWDGGDCVVDGYPNCHVDTPALIGDGHCFGEEYNTEECGWEGGDCLVDGYPECHVDIPYYIGNGHCNIWEGLNIEECGWDGGDCL